MSDDKLTFFLKNKSTCPICAEEFYREELRTGRGRLIAGDLAVDLRREYEISQKYGMVYPLIYVVIVCPSCLYAALPEDFFEAPQNMLNSLSSQTQNRKQALDLIIDQYDFSEKRNLYEGLGSYALALLCYQGWPAEFSPTIKSGILAMRAAWTAQDLHKKYPNENYDYLSQIFFKKARFYYTQAVEWEGTGEEGIGGMSSLGPDLDKNYGYDGVLFLAAYLEFKYGPKENSAIRAQNLATAKQTVARVFGMGKASKSKPSSILDSSRDLHSEIGRELKQDAENEED